MWNLIKHTFSFINSCEGMPTGVPVLYIGKNCRDRRF